MDFALTRWPMLDHAVWTVATIAVGLVVGFLINRIVINRLRRVTERTAGDWDDAVILELQRRMPFWGVLAGCWFSISYWSLSAEASGHARNLVSAIAILSVTTALAGIAVRLVSSFVPRLNPQVQVSGLMRNVVRMVIFTVGLLVILNGLGVQVTPVLAALGVGGLAVALALQEPLSNLFAGLFIALAGQIRIGDHIRLEPGPEGTVADFSWHATQLVSPGGNVVIIPNAKLAQALVTNFHRPTRESAMSVEFTIAPGSDIEAAERVSLDVAREVMRDVPGGIPGRDPAVRLASFTDLGIRIAVHVWTREFADQPLVRHEIIRRLQAALPAAGVTVATAPRMAAVGPSGSV